MLNSIAFKTLYSSGEKDSPISFFNMALSNSCHFDLGLGFFSTASFNVLCLGFAKFISNGGTMRLYINQYLSEDDYSAITAEPEKVEDQVISDFYKMLGLLSKRDRHFFNCISYLISTNRIEVKIVIPKAGGIAHQKFGIFCDKGGNRVAFNGSLNMTATALLSKNIETISCLCSWKGTDEAIDEYEDLFQQYFEGKRDDVTVITANRLSHEIIKAFPSSDEKKIVDDEESLIKEMKANKSTTIAPENATDITDDPRFPYSSGPFEYQKEACRNWINNGCTGIFAMATGTGKTITSLNCVLELYKKSGKYRLLILVPSNDLVEQWKGEVAKFNYSNVFIANSKTDWRRQLSDLSNDFAWGIESNFVIITTYATFTDDSFQKYVSRSKLNDDDLVLIADEAHNVGSAGVRRVFDTLTIKKRIALSATPNRVYDPEGTAAIESYFHDCPPYCYSFSMERAIKEGRLMKYLYFPRVAYLNSDEMSKYIKITKMLLTFYNAAENKFSDSPEVEKLLMRRKRIIHKAQDKYSVFGEILDEVVELGKAKYCFVYTPEGIDYESGDEQNIIKKMLEITNKKHPEIRTNTFLGGDNERKDKLRAFAEGKIDMLFAMKCLDEGVDVPRAEVGIFTSSTGNPRQFIQRRGRLLRKHEDKNFAYIYDTIVIPDFKNYRERSTYEMERSLVRNELMRVAYFASLATNYHEATRSIEDVTDYYGFEVSKLITELQEQ